MDGFGESLRQLRRDAGLSLTQLAARAHCSRALVGHVEAGTRRATPQVLRALDEALSAGGLLVDLYAAHEGGDEMRRRTVLSALGTLAGLGVTEQAVAESLRESLLAALGVDDWPEVTAEFGRRFMADSPAVFRTAISGELLVLRQAVTDRDTPSVRLAAPRLLALAGMATANLGDAPAATRLYRGARLAADRTRDDSLRRWVRGREAFRRGYEGAAPDEVLTLAAGVEDVEAHLAAAQAYARLRDPQAAGEALTAARQLHEHADHSEGTIYGMPGWRMAMSARYVFDLLGDVDRGEVETSGLVVPAARWDAQLRLQRAVGYARAGDVPTGVTLARAVMEALPVDQQSIVLTQMEREVLACAARS